MKAGEKVWIVLEGPDMTYYGDAEIHGVFTTREAAEMRALKADPRWTDKDYEPVRVGEYEIETEAESVRRCPVCDGRGYIPVGLLTAQNLLTGISRPTRKCSACDGEGWQSV